MRKVKDDIGSKIQIMSWRIEKTKLELRRELDILKGDII